MAMYTTGMMVVRIYTDAYKLIKTKDILSTHFKGQSHASTDRGVGDAKVEWADEHGALVSYEQAGYNGVRGWLYYLNQDLELARKLEEVINDYAIY
jgi:hypothetical protein